MPFPKLQKIRRNDSSGHINKLSDDALAGIFSRLPGMADVVRCAATCKRWMGVVSTRATLLSHSPPVRFLPQLAVGMFYLERHGPTARTRSVAGMPQPRVLAMPSGGRLQLRTSCGMIGSLFGGGAGATFLDYSRPVASRGGRLVLELQHDRCADSVTFCVCNPMTGDVVVLPALPLHVGIVSGYGCALLTGDDLRPRRLGNNNSFFQLLLIYNNLPSSKGGGRGGEGFTALRCYSSDAGRWGPEARSAVNVSSRELRHIGQAVVVHGAAFWPVDHGALGVRPTEPSMEVHLLPYDAPHHWPEGRLLGVSPDNRLLFVDFGYHRLARDEYGLVAAITDFQIRGDDIKTGQIKPRPLRESIRMHHIKMPSPDGGPIKACWIGERSGMLIFTFGGSGGHTGGAFAVNMRDGTVDKLAGDEAHNWGNFVGFEMDFTAYLASFANY